MAKSHKPTQRLTDNAIYRLNRPVGRLSKKSTLIGPQASQEEKAACNYTETL